MQMLEQEVVIGEHHPFERAVADDLHCTMKNSILRYFITHVVYTTLHTCCTFSPLSLVSEKGSWKIHLMSAQ